MLGILTRLVILGLAVASALGVGAILRDNLPPSSKIQVISSQTTPEPTPTPTPFVVDTDPVVQCGPGINSKQYVTVRRSECFAYVDCELNGSWNLIPKTKCDALQGLGQTNTTQNSTLPSSQTSLIDCTVNGRTWKDTPSQCSYWQGVAADALRKANQTIQNLPPLTVPTFGPNPTYGPIPDYAGAAKAGMDNSIQTLQDSQKMVIPPTPTPLKSWFDAQ